MLVIWRWQRAHGETLADLGWRKPTTKTAIVLAVLLGLFYLWGTVMGAKVLLPGVNVYALDPLRLLLVPLGIFMAIAEETMMRGFFITQLQRAGVPTWLQIIASGACSASYHTIQNPSLLGFLPAFVLFSIHAGLYVLGKRSLTPVALAHGIYHVFGEPYLLMMSLASMG